MIYKSGVIKGTEFNEVLQNFTVKGNLVIEDNIASSFSATNHIILPQLPIPQTSYEILVKFYIINWGSSAGRVLGNSMTNIHSPQLETPHTSRAKMNCLHPSAAYGWKSFNINYTIEKNTWYWAKIVWDGAKTYCYMSSNGVDFTSGGSVAATDCGWDEPLCLGYDMTGPLNGKIDLNEFYIKMDGKLVYVPALTPSISSYQFIAEDFYEI